MRKILICGNWKMYKTIEETRRFIDDLLRVLQRTEGVDTAICPPYTALGEAGKLLEGSFVQLGAQNVAWDREGAYTGEISPLMLKEMGCVYAIVGHSERRALFGETNEIVNKRLLNAVRFNMSPILCVGESDREREAGKTQDVIRSQFEGSLKNVSEKELSRVTIAYEPIWAIGTGKTATPEMAQEVHAFIRGLLEERYGRESAQNIQILYGGSVKAKNVSDLVVQPDIDGGLVGGASLDVHSFTEIIKAAHQTAEKV